MNKNLKEQVIRSSGVNVLKCMRCGKCSGTCPSYDEMEYHPHQFVYMVERGDIPDKEEEIRPILLGDEMVRVKQILIPASNGKTPEENRRRAEELLALARGGEDFDQLVQQYGGDINLFNNPDGYYITRGSYYPLFEETAFSLSIGEISDVIETPAGFSIVKRYEKEETYLNDHYKELAAEYQAGRMNLIAEAHQAALTVTPLPSLSDYTIFNLESTKDGEKK